jgi:thiamine kinase-like enzyme
VISLHDGLPPGPHEHLGYPLNFWRFVSRIESPAEPEEIGRTLRQCHDILRDFPQPLEPLAILTECTGVLDMVAQRNLLALPEIELLRERLRTSTNALRDLPAQPLHGDAHMGNLMNTTAGLLWTDWEDAFSGPVEWDLASIIWNAKILDEDHATVESILGAYRAAGGAWDEEALHQSIIARGAVMTAWYPVLYPNPNEERRSRLKRRLEWLASV